MANMRLRQKHRDEGEARSLEVLMANIGRAVRLARHGVTGVVKEAKNRYPSRSRPDNTNGFITPVLER